MKCQSCGANLNPNNQRCAYCGSWQAFERTEQAPPQQVHVHKHYYQAATYASLPSIKKKGVALLLCLFLGGIGAHRFYVGKTGTGLLYLFTGGLSGVGAVVDFIAILFGSFRDKDGNKLS